MPLINCPECKKEVGKGIETCPHCGYKLKKTNPILAGIGILFLIGYAIYFFETENKNLNTGSSGSTLYSNPLQVIEDGWCYGEFGTKSVCGVIVNNGSKQKSYVQVEINLYDAQGIQIGSTMDNLNNLEPHGKWKFKALILENEATSYKIKDITSF